MNLDQPGTTRPVRRAGLVDQVAELFRAEVVTGRWGVGERIPTEPELVAAFGVGRNTVREALQSLVHAGLLRREQGRGTYVISDSELAAPLGRQLAGGSRQHYLELRQVLDSAAAQLAARHRTADDIIRMRALREQREASWAHDDADARARADVELHAAVVAASHNPLYVELYSSMTGVFAQHMRDGDGDGEREHPAHELHRELVEAVAAGDGERAVAAVAGIFAPFAGA